MCTNVIVAILMLNHVNSLGLIRDSFGGALDVAVSHEVLNAVSRGQMGPTMRLHVADPLVAFGRADRAAPGYPRAVMAARAHGYEAIERLAGGRAAVFHESTLAFAIALPTLEPRAGIEERFRMISDVMVNAFRSLAIDAQIGEVPGEYCPGEWSVNVGGHTKVMGVGQRLVRGAAHVGGVVVVDEGERIRDVLIPVYRALGLDWDPRTAGALADRAPGVRKADVVRAIEDAVAEYFTLTESSLSSDLIASAGTLVPSHLPKVA